MGEALSIAAVARKYCSHLVTGPYHRRVTVAMRKIRHISVDAAFAATAPAA
ncbi:MAG: hypothetical protein WCO11_06855 [Sphingomonadales bacterium]|jgi:hypothetical protein